MASSSCWSKYSIKTIGDVWIVLVPERVVPVGIPRYLVPLVDLPRTERPESDGDGDILLGLGEIGKVRGLAGNADGRDGGELRGSPSSR